MTHLSDEIEMWLLREDRWIPAEEICARYGVRARALRTRGGKPGLCGGFAVSGPEGYRHVRHLTPEEFAAAQSQLRAHAAAEFELVHRREAARHRPLTGQGPDLREKCTDQGVFLR